jgi:hypothetical protein
MQILTPRPKMEQAGEGNFPIDGLDRKEYFLAGFYRSRNLVNPST